MTQTKQTRIVERNGSLCYEDILPLINKLFPTIKPESDEKAVSRDVHIWIQIPGGGDYSNMALEIDELDDGGIQVKIVEIFERIS